MTAAGAAAVEALPAGGLPGRAAGAWHVLGPGAAADTATARLAALIDPAFLAEAGWDRATLVLSPPAEHPLLRWRGDRRRGGVLAPAAAGGDLCGVAACPRERGNRRYCRAHYERLLRLRRADPSFNERAWQAEAAGLLVEGPGQVSLDGASARAAVELLYGLSGPDQFTAGHVTVEENGVIESEMGPWAKDKPTEEHLAKWVDSVGTVTLPLLAGFSITSVVVVSDDAVKLQWPGATILALAFAALVLIVAVQCAYHARVYLSKKEPNYRLGLRWAKRTRRFYDAGLFALLIGVGLVVVPRHVAGIQDYLRLAAVALACVALLGEAVWIWRDGWLRSE